MGTPINRVEAVVVTKQPRPEDPKDEAETADDAEDENEAADGVEAGEDAE